LKKKSSVDTSKVNWLLMLDRSVEESVVLSNIKEQNNGLEALGDVIAESNSETPVKDPNSNEGASQNTEESPTEESEVAEDGESDTVNNEESGDSVVADGEAEVDLEGGELDNPDEPEEDAGDASDPRLESLDPNLSLNRRTLISDKLLELYDDIKDTIDKIANGPSFETKPVKLKSLETLLEDVFNINESINKEPNHEALLLRYAVCLRTFNRIVEK